MRTIKIGKQNAANLFYAPMFSDVAREYRDLQSSGDSEALQRFVSKHEQSRLDRLNVRLQAVLAPYMALIAASQFRNDVVRWYLDWGAQNDNAVKEVEAGRRKE